MNASRNRDVFADGKVRHHTLEVIAVALYDERCLDSVAGADDLAFAYVSQLIGVPIFALRTREHDLVAYLEAVRLLGIYV